MRSGASFLKISAVENKEIPLRNHFLSQEPIDVSRIPKTDAMSVMDAILANYQATQRRQRRILRQKDRRERRLWARRNGIPCE